MVTHAVTFTAMGAPVGAHSGFALCSDALREAERAAVAIVRIVPEVMMKRIDESADEPGMTRTEFGRVRRARRQSIH